MLAIHVPMLKSKVRRKNKTNQQSQQNERKKRQSQTIREKLIRLFPISRFHYICCIDDWSVCGKSGEIRPHLLISSLCNSMIVSCAKERRRHCWTGRQIESSPPINTHSGKSLLISDAFYAFSTSFFASFGIDSIRQRDEKSLSTKKTGRVLWLRNDTQAIIGFAEYGNRTFFLESFEKCET